MVGAPVPGELGRDRHIGQVDVHHPGIDRSVQRSSAGPGQGLGGRELPQSDLAGVLELVVGWPAARMQVEVGRHVAGIGLGEGSHE